MTFLPQLVMNRELGLPSAQLRMIEGLEQKTADNLVKESCYSETIELPQDSNHHTYRKGDFVVVLSQSKTDRKVQRLALWSLCIRRKIWDLKIDQNSMFDIRFLKMSESGMLVINLTSQEGKLERIIVQNGEITGKLPQINWRSIIPVGNRILGSWAEKISDGLVFFFGELNHHGDILYYRHLAMDLNRKNHQHVGNEDFWVRLSGCSQGSSIIEVVDRKAKILKKFLLPHTQAEMFTSACIVQNRCIFGKIAIKSNISNSSIGIFDLVKGEIIEEFQSGRGKPESLVANQHYVAWFENASHTEKSCVKYLDLSDKQVKTVSGYNGLEPVSLNMSRTRLFINLLNWRGAAKLDWHKGVFDMSVGELKLERWYDRILMENYSFSNGIALRDFSGKQKPGMDVISYTGA